jgi:polar amino acid transport system permease protein
MLQHLLQEAPRFFTYYTLSFLFQAMLRTIGMTLFGCGFGFVCGFAIAALRLTRTPWLLPLRGLGIVYVEVFRRIPFLVILFIVMFAVQAVSDNVSLFAIAMISICLLSTAFMSEIIRSGLESVPRLQIEAAEVLNLGYLRTLFTVMLPQAWKVILPPGFAFIVMFIKDSSLASQMGVVELTFTGKVLMNRGFSPFLVYGTVMLAYFVLSYPLSRLGAYLEHRLASPRSRGPLKLLWSGDRPAEYNPVGGPG